MMASMMRAMSQNTRDTDARLDRLLRAVDQFARRSARGYIHPLPDEVAPHGWYRHFRRLLSRKNEG